MTLASLGGSFETASNAEEDMFNVIELNTEAPLYGEVWRLSRGQRTRHAWREVVKDLGDPLHSMVVHGMPYNQQEGKQMMQRESDSFIVLRERESRLQGEGMSCGTQHPQEPYVARMVMHLKGGTSAGTIRPELS